MGRARELAELATGYDSGGSINFRNRIINGDMRIDQRNAGAAVTVNATTAFFPVDRFWATGHGADGVYTLQQDSSAPAGFTKSLKATITTADATIDSAQRYYLTQIIEANNVDDLDWGTANAKTVTLSFWVRSSVTGNFGGVVTNDGFNYGYPFLYTISSADTWEYKTVTIVGPTTGTWATGTSAGIRLLFSFGTGSGRSFAAGAWTSQTTIQGVTGQTQLISTLNATWYVTGVQLEVGSVATPFERRPYGTELSLCQRYYAKTYPQGTVPGTATYDGSILVPCFGSMAYAGGTWQLPVTMRANPTTVLYSTINGNTTGKITSDATDGNGTAESLSTNVRYYRNNDSSGIGINTFLYFQGTASAEL